MKYSIDHIVGWKPEKSFWLKDGENCSFHAVLITHNTFKGLESPAWLIVKIRGDKAHYSPGLFVKEIKDKELLKTLYYNRANRDRLEFENNFDEYLDAYQFLLKKISLI